MSPEEITSMLEHVRGGKLSVEDAVERLRTLNYEDLGYAKIDHHRSLRQGFPEVVFARGKAPEQVKGIVERMLRNKHNVLVTRGDRALYELLRPLHPKMEFHALSNAISIRQDRKIRGKGKVLVVCAGTSDIPVAEEALVTATVMGNRAEGLYDVGVAGIHRLLAQSQQLRQARVIICVAGMVAVHVIAVPSSVGYGASFHGLAALLGMLNSCSPNVCVVNIDNGFGAGYLASVMNRQ